MANQINKKALERTLQRLQAAMVIAENEPLLDLSKEEAKQLDEDGHCKLLEAEDEIDDLEVEIKNIKGLIAAF